MDDVFQLEPDTRRLFEDAGLLLLASGAIAAVLLVVGVSLAALRHRLLPRWLAWAGFPAALLLPLAVSFLGFSSSRCGCWPSVRCWASSGGLTRPSPARKNGFVER